MGIKIIVPALGHEIISDHFRPIHRSRLSAENYEGEGLLSGKPDYECCIHKITRGLDAIVIGVLSQDYVWSAYSGVGHYIFEQCRYLSEEIKRVKNTWQHILRKAKYTWLLFV